MSIRKGHLGNFEHRPFTAVGITHDTYRRGNGPSVIVMHEIPGLTPEVLGLAELISDAGYHVVVPSLFGTPGKPSTKLSQGIQAVRVCISREFKALAADESGIVAGWLRALSREVYEERGGKGVGAIGLCITGKASMSLPTR